MIVSSSKAAEVIKLSYANFFPPMHKNSILGAQYCEEIKKQTQGRVEITYYPGGTLATAPKVYDAVVTGVSDMGTSHVAYTRGRFPLTEINDLPLGFSSAYVATQVKTDFYNKFKPKEWDKVHVLYFHGPGPEIVYTIKKPVRKLEDMKGLKIRGVGRMADIVKALGATPIPLEMADMYEAMRRGVVDGAFVPMESLKGWKTGEIARYATASWRAGTSTTFWVAMNKEKWNGLPADVKKVFEEVSSEWRIKQANLWDAIDIEGAEFIKSYGGEVIWLQDDEAKRWEKAVQPVIREAGKDLLSKGFTQGEIDTGINFIRERADFWRKKSKEQGVVTLYH
jgi:TRAP-type C4-dicarboxylate transport system substrate-binding protein